jgi:uncharacterized membrane protein YeaQ/YmgE (transglycosylase-associated protein family)
MDNKVFNYQYSAEKNKEAAEIRERYLEKKEESPIERLRALDSKARKAGILESLILGIIGCLIFGVAMCFGLGVFGIAEWAAIPIGIIGALLMLPAYPVYRRVNKKAKDGVRDEILNLSEKILNS